MTTVKNIYLQADDTAKRYSVLKTIEKKWGPAARLVVQEFLANAAEHCRNRRVELSLYRDGIIAYDHGGGLTTDCTRKPNGEGGHGLTLIRAFGGYLTRWSDGMRLDYRFPNP